MNEQLRVGLSCSIAGVTLTPIERVQVIAFAGFGGYVQKEPFAIIIRSEHRLRVMNIEGIDIPVEDLIKQLPQLHELL